MQVLRHRVRYHEADAQGSLFNSRYLELADDATTEFFRVLGWRINGSSWPTPTHLW